MVSKLEKRGKAGISSRGGLGVCLTLYCKVCSRDASEGCQARAGHSQDAEVTSTWELKQNVRGDVLDWDGAGGERPASG